jgi:RNA polymerase sigma-70 factor (ECF subfamily)
MKPLKTQELVSYISGNEGALEVLINRHNQRITSFIYSKVLDRDITEDSRYLYKCSLKL